VKNIKKFFNNLFIFAGKQDAGIRRDLFGLINEKLFYLRRLKIRKRIVHGNNIFPI